MRNKKLKESKNKNLKCLVKHKYLQPLVAHNICKDEEKSLMLCSPQLKLESTPFSHQNMNCLFTLQPSLSLFYSALYVISTH